MLTFYYSALKLGIQVPGKLTTETGANFYPLTLKSNDNTNVRNKPLK